MESTECIGFRVYICILVLDEIEIKSQSEREKESHRSSLKTKWAEEGQAKHSAVDSISNLCSFTAVVAQSSKGIRAGFKTA